MRSWRRSQVPRTRNTVYSPCAFCLSACVGVRLAFACGLCQRLTLQPPTACLWPADVLFTDLPAPTPENEAQWLAAQPSWRDSLRAEVLGLKLQASLLFNTELVKPHERRELERHKALTNDKLRPTRDAGGWCMRAAWGRLAPVQVTECPCSLVRAQGEVCLRRQSVFVQCVPACAHEGKAVAPGNGFS